MFLSTFIIKCYDILRLKYLSKVGAEILFNSSKARKYTFSNSKYINFPMFMLLFKIFKLLHSFFLWLVLVPCLRLLHSLSLKFVISHYMLHIFIIHAIVLIHISMSNYKFADFFLLFPSLCAFNSLKNKKNITHPQKVNINVTF